MHAFRDTILLISARTSGQVDLSSVHLQSSLRIQDRWSIQHAMGELRVSTFTVLYLKTKGKKSEDKLSAHLIEELTDFKSNFNIKVYYKNIRHN